jgi:flagellin
MSLNIVSNYSANAAHRNLASTEREISSSLAKLSAVTRVLSSKGDAESMAIGSY